MWSPGFTHRFKNLDQSKINLAAFHVYANDLNGHLVSKSVGLACILATQRMGLLEIPVVVVCHAGDVHEPFDEMFDQLDEDTERCDPGNEAGEFVADLVGHEPHLFPLHQLALRVIRAALHFGRMTRDFGKLVLQLGDPIITKFFASHRAE